MKKLALKYKDCLDAPTTFHFREFRKGHTFTLRTAHDQQWHRPDQLLAMLQDDGNGVDITFHGGDNKIRLNYSEIEYLRVLFQCTQTPAKLYELIEKPFTQEQAE